MPGRWIKTLAVLALAALTLLPSLAMPAPQWATAAASPVPRFEGAVAVVGDKLYAFGGFDANLVSQSASHVYDPGNNTWAAIAAMPRAVSHVQAAVVGRYVYLAGGFEGPSGGAPIAEVQRYDTLTDTWDTTTVPDLPAARASAGFVALAGALHYLGGLQPDRCTDTTEHWRLDTANLSAGWIALAAMPESKNHFQAVAVDGRVYVLGGQRGHDCGGTNLRSAHVYNPQNNTWSALAQLPSERSHFEPSIFEWNGHIVIGGGVSNSANALATLIAYDIADDAWISWPDLPAPRRSPILQRIGERLIYGTGGAPPNGITSSAAMFVNLVRADAPKLLFLRGADRSGGFLEAGNDAQRTEQLADIGNFATAAGNHGWGELRATLESEGFVPSQIAEQAETPSGPAQGLPIPLSTLVLTNYASLVFGSNNAVYGSTDAARIGAYVRAGGGVLFVSDANFGGDWADAPNSDQTFLAPFGLTMHQDAGTYALERASGDFLLPAHPLFAGVDAVDGEGVSPALQGAAPFGVVLTRLAGAEGQLRVNTPPFGALNQGALRPAGSNDGAIIVGSAGRGRIAVHFDRNTFFNLNGAGTSLHRFDNRAYAINLFGWLARNDGIFADGFDLL